MFKDSRDISNIVKIVWLTMTLIYDVKIIPVILSWHSTVIDIIIPDRHTHTVLSMDHGRTRLMSSVVCHKVAFVIQCYFFYTPPRLLSSPIDTLVCWRHTASNPQKGRRSRIIDTTLGNMYWWDKLLDVSQSLEIKYGHSSIHSVGYQTAARQSGTQTRLHWWRGYTVLRRCHLPGPGVRQRIEVFYTHQAVTGNCFYHLRQMRSVRR